MALQFLHVDTVARSVPKKATTKRWALSDVLAEANRVDDACPHIEKPQMPTRLYGVPLSIVESAALRRANDARDAMGRRLRKDAPVMIAGVTSYPIRVTELDETTRVDLAAWEKRTTGWLRSRFGDGLASVIRHTDEEFPHLHFFVVPELTDAMSLNLEAVHPGIGARELAKRAGKSNKEANRSYCEAMRALQNDFHEAVGIFHGHLRHGPRRRRLSRGAYLSEQQEAQRRAKLMNKVENELADLEMLRVEVALNSRARERVDILEVENRSLREEVERKTLAAETASREAETLRKDKSVLRAAAAHSAKVIFHFVGLIVSGEEKYRSFFMSCPLPHGVHPEPWERLRLFLFGSKDTPDARARSRKRADDERTHT
ncbi:plasmid recombination protein [Parvibaculum sp.]|uniref:plasmid recombination protein n=1 Tax=Parvibaculum sp. TaxID=2024848 RepID=UPI001DAE0E24|nr:plasmid recombination protein [Parvibaculum sp.]MBX3491011.1 hypothetical protein [Parvibaculum sp.]